MSCISPQLKKNLIMAIAFHFFGGVVLAQLCALQIVELYMLTGELYGRWVVSQYNCHLFYFKPPFK